MSDADLDRLVEVLATASRPVPATELAGALGVTPQSLPGLIARLRALGVPVAESGAGIGLEATDLLDEETIARRLAARGVAVPVRVHRLCDSTNRLAAAGAVTALHLAELQTAGRGRRGQSWRQPFAGGLALSYVCPVPAGRLDGLAVALAVAVVEALERLGYRGLRLKWPNDIYAGDAKLGGLMVQLEGGGAPRLVAGLGLNVHAAPAIPDRSTAALDDCGAVHARNDLAVVLAAALAEALALFGQAGFAGFAGAYARLDLLAGRAVRLATPRGAVEGVVRGVGIGGELAIETPEGVNLFTAGEVSLGACPRP